MARAEAPFQEISMFAVTSTRSPGLVHRLLAFDPPADAVAPYVALLLRLMLTCFFWAHLYNKFFTKGGFWSWWAALTDRHAAYVPIYVLTVEFSCAILLPLGLRTRWVALYAIPSFIGIIAFWLNMGGYWFTNPGAEFPVMWMCMLVLQLALGDGAYALRLGNANRPITGRG
jgi:putative oxidoreductase